MELIPPPGLSPPAFSYVAGEAAGWHWEHAFYKGPIKVTPEHL